MGTINIGISKFVRIAEAKVDVRLRSEVKDGINVVLAKHSLHASWRSNVPLVEGEIRPVIENPRVVERGAVVKLVEGNNMVLWIGEDQVPDKPACAADTSAADSSNKNESTWSSATNTMLMCVRRLHEAGSTRDENVFCTG